MSDVDMTSEARAITEPWETADGAIAHDETAGTGDSTDTAVMGSAELQRRPRQIIRLAADKSAGKDDDNRPPERVESRTEVSLPDHVVTLVDAPEGAEGRHGGVDGGQLVPVEQFV